MMTNLMNNYFFCPLFSVSLLCSSLFAAEEFGDTWGTAEREQAHYRLVNVPMPEGVYLEADS